MFSDLKATLDAVRAFFLGIEKWVKDNAEAIEGLARTAHHHILFDKAGWLPHYSTPFSLIDDEFDAKTLSDFLNEYYRSNWPQVRSGFEARLADSEIDQDAKETFTEALDAHGYGLYRTTARLLFPEIERVARVELFEGKPDRIASLKEVREAVGKLGLSEMVPKGGGPVFAQFATMAHHLYETAHTVERVAELASDPVPNRHASVHGLVTYRTMQSSLNALIMTEFMFRVIPAVKNRTPE